MRWGKAKPASEGWPLAGGTDNEGCSTLVDGGNEARDGVREEDSARSRTRAELAWCASASASSLRFFATLR